MLGVERLKSNTLQADVLRFGAASYKLVATTFGVILSPHSKREMRHINRQSWNGCTWKKTSLILMLVAVEER